MRTVKNTATCIIVMMILLFSSSCETIVDYVYESEYLIKNQTIDTLLYLNGENGKTILLPSHTTKVLSSISESGYTSPSAYFTYHDTEAFYIHKEVNGIDSVYYYENPVDNDNWTKEENESIHSFTFTIK